jgi:hypothetical protein
MIPAGQQQHTEAYKASAQWVLKQSGRAYNSISTAALYMVAYNDTVASTTGGATTINPDNAWRTELVVILMISEQFSLLLSHLYNQFLRCIYDNLRPTPASLKLMAEFATFMNGKLGTFQQFLHYVSSRRGSREPCLTRADGRKVLVTRRRLVLKKKLAGKPESCTNEPPTGRNAVLMHAFMNNNEYDFPSGYSRTSTGDMIPHTMSNTQEFMVFPDGDDGRPGVFSLNFTGTLSYSKDGNMYLQLTPMLVRYVFLDVDKPPPMPISNTNTADPTDDVDEIDAL